MTFKEFFPEAEDTEEPEQWYHGTPHKIERFSDEFVGQGNDQEGPGMYFTTNYEDAVGYSRKGDGQGELLTVELNMKKMVPLTGKASVRLVRQMMNWAPDLADKLQDWDENPKTAMNNAIHSFLRQDSPLETFKSVWYDFYRQNPIDFVRNMVTIGYDGFIVQKSFMNTKHAIVYNPKCIRIIDRSN